MKQDETSFSSGEGSSPRLTLNSGRGDFNNLGRLVLVHAAKAVHVRSERSFGRRVCGHRHRRYEREVAACEGERGRVGFRLQLGQEFDREIHQAGEVGGNLGMEGVEVDLLGLGEKDR